MDSMSFGIPVLSFSNDFLRPFDQANWSLADEVIGIQDLIIQRGDFAEFKRRLGKLIEQPALRERLGSECKARITQTKGNPERMIRRMEEIYSGVAREQRAEH
jgi:glycosyltransferase involved in cell wall biosynthesis